MRSRSSFLLFIDELWPIHQPRALLVHIARVDVPLFCCCSLQPRNLRRFVVWPLLLDCSVSWYLMVSALLAPGAPPALGVLVALGSLGLEQRQ